MRKIVPFAGVVSVLFLLLGTAYAQKIQEEGQGGLKVSVRESGPSKKSREMGGYGMMHRGEMMHGCAMMAMEERMEKNFAMCLQNAREIGLNEKQLASLKKLHREKRKNLIRLRSEIQIVNVDLQEELEKPVPDLDSVKKLLRTQESLKTEFVLEMVRTRVEVSKILTDEQFENLRDMMKGMMGNQGMSGM